MDFDLSETQRKWHREALEFARTELVDPTLPDRDHQSRFWREGFERCGRFGFQGLPIPKDHGGQGEDLATTVAAMEGLGEGCLDHGLIFALNAALWTVSMPIAAFGSELQKQRYLPGLCSGRLIGANGASEPEAGSDIFSMRTTAIPDDHRWILNGRKTWITAGPIADLFLLFASTNPTLGVMGVSAFLVERETPGLTVVREIPKMGMRTVPMGELLLENCVIPAQNILGREGRGGPIFQESLEWERGAILASAVGVMKRQLDLVIAHARKRKQFGQPIGKFQSVSNRIVEMALRLETSRLLVYRYAWAKSRGDQATAPASMAKLHVSESFLANSLDAVRVLGALGYAVEGGLERDLRDSVAGVIFSGTNDIQRNIIARRLGVG